MRPHPQKGVMEYYLEGEIKERFRKLFPKNSNNNIRSVHPDLKNRKIIVKQFNGEDMVIENVENYELCAANEMSDYDL